MIPPRETNVASRLNRRDELNCKTGKGAILVERKSSLKKRPLERSAKREGKERSTGNVRRQGQRAFEAFIQSAQAYCNGKGKKDRGRHTRTANSRDRG